MKYPGQNEIKWKKENASFNVEHTDESLMCCCIAVVLKIKYQTGTQKRGWTSTISHVSSRGSGKSQQCLSNCSDFPRY